MARVPFVSRTSAKRQNTEESTPCATSTKIKPDSRGTRPGMTKGRWCKPSGKCSRAESDLIERLRTLPGREEGTGRRCAFLPRLPASGISGKYGDVAEWL